MKATILKLLTFTILTLCLLSCGKEKNGNTNPTGSKTELLTASKWTLLKIEYQKKSDGTWVNKPLEEGVEFSLSFKKDKTVVTIDGGHSTVKGWVASDDFSQLTLSSPSGSATTLTVLELSGSTLKISPLSFSSSIYSNERDTFTH